MTGEKFWLRSYNPEDDSESWSNGMDIHTIKALELKVQRKGHMTRVYTEAEMAKSFDRPEVRRDQM